jgi:SulP family sulfate permease
MLNPSRVFHGGPNTAMSATIGVTLLPTAPPFGAEYMGYALTLGLMAGLIQLMFYLIRPLGRMLDLISEPVINGMICGIGLFLIFRSLTTFGGLPLNTEVEWPLWIAWQSILAVLEVGNLYAIQVGLITLVTCVIVQQFDRLRNWAILFGIAAGTLYSEYLSATLGRRDASHEPQSRGLHRQPQGDLCRRGVQLPAAVSLLASYVRVVQPHVAGAQTRNSQPIRDS